MSATGQTSIVCRAMLVQALSRHQVWLARKSEAITAGARVREDRLIRAGGCCTNVIDSVVEVLVEVRSGNIGQCETYTAK